MRLLLILSSRFFHSSDLRPPLDAVASSRSELQRAVNDAEQEFRSLHSCTMRLLAFLKFWMNSENSKVTERDLLCPCPRVVRPPTSAWIVLGCFAMFLAEFAIMLSLPVVARATNWETVYCAYVPAWCLVVGTAMQLPLFCHQWAFVNRGKPNLYFLALICAGAFAFSIAGARGIWTDMSEFDTARATQQWDVPRSVLELVQAHHYSTLDANAIIDTTRCREHISGWFYCYFAERVDSTVQLSDHKLLLYLLNSTAPNPLDSTLVIPNR